MVRYNGWTNYETWRINLEYGLNDNMDLYDGIEAEIDPILEYIKGYVEDSLESENSMATSYALLFISDVDWYEITEHILDNLKELK